MVGRNEYRKGFHILVQALGLIDKSIELHLVGDWPDIESTHHHVTYHGVVRDKYDMMAIMDDCDVLILPSLSEGMPTVVLEAMARRLQVIAANVGAVNELETTIIPSGDPKALASEIRQSALGQSAKALIDKYRWNQISRATITTFQNCGEGQLNFPKS